jgi:hypothetical protein
VFSVESAPRLYNEDLTQLELELGRVLEMAVEGDLDWEKKTPCVIWSYSQTVINPLPGYD